MAQVVTITSMALAWACRQVTPPSPRTLVLGPQITCLTGPAPVCTSDDPFQVPADLAPLVTATELTSGLRHGCLITTGGVAQCWGDASVGQLGVDPSTVVETVRGRPCRRTPATVPGVPPLQSIDAGWLHTCGLTTDGGVVCWGDDSLDQLGRLAPSRAAAPVAGLPGRALAVAAGGVHSCALLADGTVYCWGDGSAGQLGQGETVDSPSPVAVGGLTGKVVQIAAGGYHTCAVLADGGVQCWGENRFGQLGDGTCTNRSTAVAVVGLAGPSRSVAVGFSFTCALLQDGTVQCWGSNELGELGIGSSAGPPGADGTRPPVTVKGLDRGVIAVHAHGSHACAELEGGAIACWGANELGQLGDGTVTDRDVPTPWLGKCGQRPHRPVLDGAGTLQGIDVSYHSGRIDWENVASSGHRFGLTLATAGVDFRDPFLAVHWERMRQVGLIRGAYHFFVAADDPEEQARAFLSHVSLEPGDLAPVVDIEKVGTDAPPDLPARLRAFVQTLESALSVKPIIYTGPTFWNQHMNAEFGGYPLWIAEYGVDQPRLPNGWTSWHLWQFKGNADLPGIAPIVDLDRLHPDLDIRELLIPEPALDRTAAESSVTPAGGTPGH